MARPPEDVLVYVERRLGLRRRRLTRPEIEALRRRGLALRRLGWLLTVPLGLAPTLVIALWSIGSRERFFTFFVLLFLIPTGLYGWFGLWAASRGLRRLEEGAELVDHETSGGTYQQVLVPAALVMIERARPLRLPRPTLVRTVAVASDAIEQTRRELAEAGSRRGQRNLTQAETSELERLRDAMIRPGHWIAAAIYTGVHVPFIMLLVSYGAIGWHLQVALTTLFIGLILLFIRGGLRRIHIVRALRQGVVTVITSRVAGSHLERLPGSRTVWTENGRPANWRLGS